MQRNLYSRYGDGDGGGDLQALGSVQFLSNVFFATVVLREEATTSILQGTCFILLGNGLLIAYGNHDSHCTCYMSIYYD